MPRILPGGSKSRSHRIFHICFLAISALLLAYFPCPLAITWKATNYDDSSWTAGPAELGYGDGDEATVIDYGSDPNNKYITYYFRKLFYMSNTDDYDELILRVNYDDGFIAYINDEEVARSPNMPPAPTPIANDTLAMEYHEGGTFEQFDVSDFLARCEKGWGEMGMVLAIEVHQWDPGSSDISFDAWLVGADSDWNYHTFIEAESHWRYFDSGSEPPPVISDPITVIEKPLINIPVIVKSGEDFTIQCNAAPSAENWQAEIFTEYQSFPLPVTTPVPLRSRFFLPASVPTEVPEELYSLRVTASGGIDDTVTNAVKVIREFKDSYTFVHITDAHVPEHFQVSEDDVASYDSVPDFEDVVREINIISPEFVLLTGDAMNRGQCEDHHEVLQNLVAQFEVPVFFTSGNHEIASWCGDNGGEGENRDRRYFWKYFGWDYLRPDSPENIGHYTQDYSFDYGNAHFVGLESYYDYTPNTQGEWWDTYGYGNFAGDEFQASSQLDWLRSDLTPVPTGTKKYLFYHYNFYHLDPPEHGSTPVVTATPVDHLQPILEDYNVSACFSGNTHEEEEYYDGSTLMLNPGAVVRDRKYRVVKIVDGGIVEHHALTSGGLNLSFYPPNDGTHEGVTATLDNRYTCSFEDVLIRFRVRDTGKVPRLYGDGRIVRVVDAGDYLIYYVTVDVAAGSTTSTAVSHGTVRINFQTPGAAIPGGGWLKDFAGDFDSDRGYGWQ